jgi:translation initiation factor IF-3
MKGVGGLPAAQSLCKVFISSIDLVQPTSISFVPAMFLRLSVRLLPSTSVQIRTYAQAASLKRRLPRDEEITASEVRLVDENGTFHPPTPVRQLLASFDRRLFHLVAVSTPKTGETPVCKIISRRELRERERAKRVKKDVVKQLELNWAIDPNDLGHRLNKLQEFLAKGWRVEVILANKRRGRQASPEEAAAVIKRIRGIAEEVGGAKEWRAADGRVLGQMTMFFEGNRQN